VSAHGLILSSFFSIAALVSMLAGFNVNFELDKQYPFWLVVAGTIILFVGGILGHVGRQMEKSSRRFSLSNLIFYFLSLGSAACLATSVALDTFGDSSKYCTVAQLGKLNSGLFNLNSFF